MFAVHDKVVYPAHGVAVVNQIINKFLGGTPTQLYELKFVHKDMTILVPIDNLTAVGIRRLSSREVIAQLWEILSDYTPVHYHEIASSTWNKRNKKYQHILRSGNIQDIGNIYRELQMISRYKELSFGERTLLAQIELLLAQEISFVENLDSEEAVARLRECCTYKPIVRIAVPNLTL